MESEFRRWYEDGADLGWDDAPGGVVIYYADGDEEIIRVNQYVVDLFECDSIDDFLNHVQGSFRGFVHSEDIGAAEDSIWGQVKKHGSLDHINYRIKTKTGKLVNVEDFGRLVKRAGERPVFHVFITKTTQKDSLDWLTGLPSMARFHNLAMIGAAEIAERGGQTVAVALDLVGMKAFNTQFGRREGDNLLCMFADVLRKHFGSEACSRFGEDHYYAFAAAEGFDAKIKALFEDFTTVNEGRVLPVRAGAYLCDADDDIVAVGFDRAKMACDLDRRTWRSHLVWFNDEMRAQERLRIHVLACVDEAIEKGWVRPYYQAVVRTSTGHVCGEEALARWIDPDFGELAPEQFVPVLEDAGLLQKVDMHIVDCVLRDIELKRAEGVAVVPVSVNVSLRDIGQLDIAAEITAKVDAAGLPRGLLRIEFTESAASDNPNLFNQQVKTLRDAGFEVWMDDFGSGYSSLNVLQNFEFDLIKLDMGFIDAIDNPKAKAIMAGIVHVAKQLGVGTLAEGVETEEQALFLEDISCGMVQGYYYSRALPVEVVIDHAKRGLGMPRENRAEFTYWNAVGAVDLDDPMSGADVQAVDGTQLDEFPTGVMERRDDEWRVLRANKAFRSFLDRGGVLPLSEPRLQAHAIGPKADIEYMNAARRSIESGKWERVAGRLEYGTGLQFFTRSIAYAEGADAFAVASVPNTFGSALGAYGDVPAAYAVLRVTLADSGDEVADAEYVYANPAYCAYCHYYGIDLPGKSFLSLSGEESWSWFPFLFRAAVLKEDVHGVMYSHEVGHWLSFNVAPSLVSGCCVFAFLIADDERRERDEIASARDTSNLIIDITNVFNQEGDYSSAMNDVLQMIGQVINPKRLFIFERDGDKSVIAFEWAKQGLPSRAGTSEPAGVDMLEAWDNLAEGNSVIRIDDVTMLQGTDEGLYRMLIHDGITHMLAALLINDGRTIAYLVAENYEFEKGIDVERLLETVAPYISAKMVNQKLLAELEKTSAHDHLTGLLNRRGFDRIIAEHLREKAGEPYVLALMDIDDFKTVNDVHGHDVGDAALKAIAATIIENVPANAVYGRNGGDEFVVALFGDDARRADEIFGALSDKELSCEHNGVQHPLSMSIGYAGYPDEANDLADAYTKADAALYAVKLAGKAGYKRYVPEVLSQYRMQLGFTPRDIAENVPGAILVITADAEGKILFVNDEFVEMLGCVDLADFMEYSGGTVMNVFPPDDRLRAQRLLTERVSLQGEGYTDYSHFRVITKSGDVRHVASNGRVVEVEDVGKVLYALFIDMDARKGR